MDFKDDAQSLVNSLLETQFNAKVQTESVNPDEFSGRQASPYLAKTLLPMLKEFQVLLVKHTTDVNSCALFETDQLIALERKLRTLFAGMDIADAIQAMIKRKRIGP